MRQLRRSQQILQYEFIVLSIYYQKSISIQTKTSPPKYGTRASFIFFDFEWIAYLEPSLSVAIGLLLVGPCRLLSVRPHRVLRKLGSMRRWLRCRTASDQGVGGLGWRGRRRCMRNDSLPHEGGE